MAYNTPADALSAFFAQEQSGVAQSNPTITDQLDSAMSDPELDTIKNQKASLRAKINVLGLFQQEVQGMIDNIDKSAVVLVLTDVATLGGGDGGQVYKLISEYIELTARQRRLENKPLSLIPVWVTAVRPAEDTYLGRLQCLPRLKSISDRSYESIGLTEVASGIRDLYDAKYANSPASLSVVCSPQNYDMFAKVTAHLLASGVIDNKYYHSGFQLLTNPVQQEVLDNNDPVSGAIDRHITKLYADNPGGDMLAYAKLALQGHPDTAGIIEHIDSSDIILLGMHADLLGKRRYRLVERYLKHVAEQRELASKPFAIIPVYLGTCEPDSWLNRYRAIPTRSHQDEKATKPSIETSLNKESVLVDCTEGIARITKAFVMSQGMKQLQCFPLYPISQMPTVDRFISHLQAIGLVGNSQETIATAPIKIVQTEQIQAIKSQHSLGNKNRLMQFVGEMTTKLPHADVILSMVDAETLATQQFDAFCAYVADLKLNQTTIGLYSVLVSALPSRDKLSGHKVLSPYGEVLKTGNLDTNVYNVMNNLDKHIDKSNPPKKIIIVATEANRDFAERINVSLAYYRRQCNTAVDFLYI